MVLEVSFLYSQEFPDFKFRRIEYSKASQEFSCNYIFIDSQGFMWISTSNGLYRFDGNKEVVFKNDPSNPFSIAFNHINYIIEDKYGDIWVSHIKGISRLNTKTQKFTNFISDESPTDTLKGARNSKLVVDKYGNLLNCSIYNTELRYFDYKKNKFVKIPIDTINDGLNRVGIPNENIGSISDVQWDGSLYMFGWNGLFLLDTKTFKRTRMTDQPLIDPLDVFKDHKGNIWLGEWGGGLSKIGPHSKTNFIKDRRINNIREFKDKNGKYWLIMSDLQYGSIIIVDPETGKYKEKLFNIENEKNPNITPAYILIDSARKIYVNSFSGLAESSLDPSNFTNTFTYELGKPVDLFYNNLVRSGIALDGGGYMISLMGYQGICILDKNINIRKRIKTFRYKGKEYDLDVRNMERIGEDKYMFSGHTGFMMMQKGIITPIKYVSSKDFLRYNSYDSIPVSKTREFAQISNAQFMVRTLDDKLKIFDIHKKEFIKEFQYIDKSNKILIDGIRYLATDRNGDIWLNSLNKIYKYNKSDGTFDIIKIKNETFNKEMYSIGFDLENNLFICGNWGLLKYNTLTKKETLFNDTNGIPNSKTYKVVFDKDNNAWFTTSLSLATLNNKTQQITNFTKKDGLALNYMEYNVAFFIDKSNNIVVGNSGVVSKANIGQLLAITNPSPKVVITEARGIDGFINFSLNQLNKKHVNLMFKNFPVNIHFSIIDFTTSSELKYYFRYKGDEKWNEVFEGIVPINTIEPGNYTLEVRGKVDNTYSNTDIISFTILAKWYQTKLFFYSCIALILSFIAGLIKWRIDTINKNAVQETKIQKLAAEKYKNQYELEQISNYFTNSLHQISTINEVLWDVTRNLIGKLGFEDCMIYLWNKDKTKLVQIAGYGPNGFINPLETNFDVTLGEGIVGHVAQSKQSIIVNNTKLDDRYRPDEVERLSEICVPIVHENEVIGIIDAEHSEKDHFSEFDLQLLQTIAGNIAIKIRDIESKEELEIKKKELAVTMEDLKGAQLDALRSQMNPHFIFNSLNSIENYILKNEKIKASEYLGKFSKLIRNILDNSKSERIPLDKEIETLKLYVELERLRTGHNFDVTYYIPDNLLDDNILIPPMLMQPHVENAILHGLRYLEDKKGQLIISLHIINEEWLEYSIQDNGIGRQKSQEIKTYSNSEHKSYGLDITNKRIEIYNQKYLSKIKFSIEDINDKNNLCTGTKVSILIPLN